MFNHKTGELFRLSDSLSQWTYEKFASRQDDKSYRLRRNDTIILLKEVSANQYMVLSKYGIGYVLKFLV
jgi:hypothetical protein